MTKLVLKESAVDQFRSVTEPVEVFDESGHRIGYFNPAADRSLYENVVVPVSEEELDRIQRQPGGRTWPEIRADLERRA